MLSYLYAFHFVPSEKKILDDEEVVAVVVIIGGGGGIAVIIGLYKLDALAKLGKYLDSRNQVLKINYDKIVQMIVITIT